MNKNLLITVIICGSLLVGLYLYKNQRKTQVVDARQETGYGKKIIQGIMSLFA